MPMNLAAFLIVGRKHGEGATTGDYNTGKAMVGTGPYRYVSFVINDRTVMQRNDAWWGPKQDWERATVRLITSNASRVAALQAGDVDAIDAVPTRDVAALKNDARLTLLPLPGTRLIYLSVDVGFDLLPGSHPITPVMFPGEDGARRAAQIADEMLSHGVYVIAFSYPVVPKGRARIRVQLSAAHSEADVRTCVAAFVAARDAVG